MISVIPFVNGAILTAAEKLDIPFVLITLDFHPVYFLCNVQETSYQKFLCTFIFNDLYTDNKNIDFKLKDFQKVTVGFPLRSSFFEKKDRNTLKTTFDIPQDKPVVLVCMGGTGSAASYDYLKEIAKITIPVHIIICLGRNERLRKKIEKIKLKPHIATTIFGFTDKNGRINDHS
ncbi:MAG: hypothetical protein WA432_03440 [Candidatus Babeliaceae bacterium]